MLYNSLIEKGINTVLNYFYKILVVNNKIVKYLNAKRVIKAIDKALEFLNEEEYTYLQTLGDFDLKSSSWIKTDSDIRVLGGALFGDKRYGRTFIYHNGAESYYSGRGFRSKLII